MAAPVQYVNCPQCGGSRIQKVGFTWWGGVLGPSLLTHVQCQDCKTAYNGKTGQSNEKAIRTYLIVSVVITLLLCVLIFMAKG